MRKLFPLLICLFLICFNKNQLLSQEYKQTDTTDIIPIDEITITGTKSQINRSLVPLTISVIDNKTITESTETSVLPVLSEQIPGIFVTERGVTGFGVSTGAAGQISIRGIGGSPTTQVLFLLNGNPQFMGIMGHPLADAYRASNIEKVEIIRGPASTLYGSNAMGGVINIITKESEEKGFSGKAGLSYGSYNTIKLHSSAGYKNEKFNAYLGVSHDQTDGHRPSSYFDITDGYTHINYKVTDKIKITADFSIANFNSADPGYDTSDITTPVAGDTIDIIRSMGSVAINNTFKNFEGSARLFFNFGNHNITNGFSSRDNCYGIIIYETFHPTETFSVLTGFDYKIYGGFAENKIYNTFLIDTSSYELAGYIVANKKIKDKLIINGGIRIDANKFYGKELIPTIGADYRINSNTFIKSSISKGYRSPTIRELYMFGTANENLLPESTWNYEAGILSTLFKNKLHFELTAFYIQGKDIIQSIYTGTGYQYQNVDEIKNSGIELSCKLSVSEKLNLSANYSYIYTEQPLLATPKHKSFFGTNYKLTQKTTINLSWQFVNDLVIETDPDIIEETYNLINLRINYKLNKLINLYFKVDNILNTEYTINYGYPMPGILFFGGINIDL